jgi:hypothetical protein
MRESSRCHRKAGLAAFSFIKGGAFRSFFALILLLGLVLTTWRVIPHVPAKAHAQGTTPIQHIVFIVKENHSFDSYFGRFPAAHGATSGLVKVKNIRNEFRVWSHSLLFQVISQLAFSKQERCWWLHLPAPFLLRKCCSYPCLCFRNCNHCPEEIRD